MTALDETATDSHVRTLGLARWVQASFMVFGLLLMWLLEKLATVAWQYFAEPNANIINLAAFVVAGVVAFVLYRNATIHRITTEVVGELARVTWPSRNETQAATVVVIIASVIAAVIVGTYDAAWSAITDLIY